MSQTFVELLAKDLTRSGKTYCPNPTAGMEIWITHPRVFLDPKAGEAKCPYCGTVYRLKAGEVASAGH